jgi:hypothetical protein
VGSFNDDLENKLLDVAFGGTAYTTVTPVFLAAFTAAPTDAGGGTECAGGSYARLSVTNNATNFPAASGGAKANGTSLDFIQATGSWGTVVAIAIMSLSSGGVYLGWDDFTGVAIASGDTLRIPVGDLDITLD